MPDFDFDIPEFNRIAELMQEIGGPEAPAPGKAPKPPAPKAAAVRFRMGATTLAAFAEAVNWKNDMARQSPFGSPNAKAGPRLGALSVAAFAGGANWSNSIGAPPLLTEPADTTPLAPPPTLDLFMSEFAWD
jgi:hypothetical protein